MYPTLKGIHLAAAALTLALFILRGVWMMQRSSLLRHRWVRIVPHLIDTLLLASAVGLMLHLQQYPLMQAWLSAKVLAVLLYIALGFMALHYGHTPTARVLAFIAALAVFAYIVVVALTRDPLPFLSVS